MRVTINQQQVGLFARRILRKQINKVLDEGLRAAKAAALAGPYATGELSRKTRKLGPIIVGDRVEGSIGTLARHGKWKDQGTRAHLIVPVRQKYLKFYWRKKGRWVSFKRVTHPGYKGDGWLTESVSDVARRAGFRVNIR